LKHRRVPGVPPLVVTEAKALAAIVDDLSALRRERRAHFGVGAAAAGMLLGVMVASMIRGDLLAQPWPALGAQIALWVLGLVALPAIGVGLWFPRRRTTYALAVATLGLAVVAAFGSGAALPLGAAALEPRCLMGAGMAGAVGLLLALSSGAFVQCRRSATKLWLAASIGILSLVGIAWMCSEPGHVHVLVSHAGAAFGVTIVAIVLGTRARTAITR
jgi:hypothetical protein